MKQASENRFCPGEVGQSVTVNFQTLIGPVVILETLLKLFFQVLKNILLILLIFQIKL
jgi:hypothetical protein